MTWPSPWPLKVRDKDRQDNTFGSAQFQLSLSVRHGTLAFSSRDTIASSVTFLVGSLDCTTCRTQTVRGTMCGINTALEK